MSDEGYYHSMARPVRMNNSDTAYHVLSRVRSGRALSGKILSRAGFEALPSRFFSVKRFWGELKSAELES